MPQLSRSKGMPLATLVAQGGKRRRLAGDDEEEEDDDDQDEGLRGDQLGAEELGLSDRSWLPGLKHHWDVEDLEALKMATPERPYRMYHSSGGVLRSAHGVLIPEPYKLRYETPDTPWVCPVRDCRRLFSSVTAMGGHWPKHRGCLLNDNLDGTFSIVGTYSRILNGEPNLNAVVISQGPCDPDEPIATPQVAAWNAGRDEHDVMTCRSALRIFNPAGLPRPNPVGGAGVGNSGSGTAAAKAAAPVSTPSTQGSTDAPDIHAASPMPATAVSSSQMRPRPPSHDFVVEDWEAEPGYIQSQEEDHDKIAFSSDYLSKDPVPVADGISFRVETISPHTGRSFKVMQTATRICSLASGKLIVRLQNEPELWIGPHGMFKINPGAECIVWNSLDDADSVLHVSTIVTDLL
ncbi:hypothetical protein GGTG_00917 [Gaeumannomyces tritici R3-111a-1]|uniref:C2H2-type domain-containing protein n=1 Tax=Gaeumannomyces tritici (strain R3-111a-1) TaxID=644352 RepID=J3NI33_GAET3|nr:hypothetical protein GGTG_00917 [Gaeumannomyces tritici R3-111a-1]EJT80926.1 hypothetical protein GGTG_00917 [Gaeumannomyces tritici R3-111a-1]